MKTIGLLGGMSWESTAVYYAALNRGARARLGGLHSAELLLRSFDFARVEALQSSGDWNAAGALLADAARALELAGADCLLLCTNTMHRVADTVQGVIDVPLLHIADATAEAVRAAGAERPLLLATRYTMEQDFYTGRLRGRHGIDVRIPPEPARGEVHRVIYDELCVGRIEPASRGRYVDAVRVAVEDGADSVVFGCTEVGLLISADDVPVPAFDTTTVHVEAALEFAFR